MSGSRTSEGVRIQQPAWRGWFSPTGLFAAGLFCWVLAIALGAKFVAAGQVFMTLAIVGAGIGSRGRAFIWRNIPTSAWCLAAFVVIAALSVVFNRAIIADPWEHLGKLRHLVLVLALLALPSLALRPLSELWRRDSLVLAWFGGLSFAIAVGLIGWLTGSHPLRGDDVVTLNRFTGIYGQVMTFAYSLQFSVLALVSFCVGAQVWNRVTRVPWWLLLAITLAAAGALYLSYTRGAMLGVLSGLAVYGACRSWKIALVIVFAGGILVGTVGFGGKRSLDARSDGRLAQWRAASLAFLERPVLGWGFRNFEPHSAELKERYGFEKDVIRKRGQKPVRAYFESHAHNNFLEAFASTGFAGGLAFLAFALSWWDEARRSPHRLFLLPGVTAFLVSGCFENTFFDSEVLNCLMLLYLFTCWTKGKSRVIPTSPDPV